MSCHSSGRVGSGVCCWGSVVRFVDTADVKAGHNLIGLKGVSVIGRVFLLLFLHGYIRMASMLLRGVPNTSLAIPSWASCNEHSRQHTAQS